MSSRSSNRPSNAPKTITFELPALHAELQRKIEAPHLPVLVVLTGNELGTRVVVRHSMLIGRAQDADLSLSDPMISWHHARIEDRGDAFVLFDLGSTNGTTVNGETKPEFVLRPNDRIVFGSTAVSFEREDALKAGFSEAVERLLNLDDLTGLLVRRKFDADLAVLLDGARARKTPVALLVMDLDGVKAINDTHGHRFGEYVIARAGRRIGELVAPLGLACRFGGDEYLAALPGLDADAAHEVAERVVRAIGDATFEKDGVSLRPGISVGVAAFPDHATDAETLFQRADEALYRAKQGGRNRVCR